MHEGARCQSISASRRRNRTGVCRRSSGAGLATFSTVPRIGTRRSKTSPNSRWHERRTRPSSIGAAETASGHETSRWCRNSRCALTSMPEAKGLNMPSSRVLLFTDPLSYQVTLHGAEVELFVATKGEFRAELTQINLHKLWMQRADETLPR